MGRKTRVHELAKELGVPSKEIIARLAADGEKVKSASTTVEAPVAGRLRESFGTAALSGTAAPPEDRQHAPAATTFTPQRREQPPSKSRGTSKFSSADALDLYKRYRLLSVSEGTSEAISDLFREFEDKFGLTRRVLRNVVASEKLRSRLAQQERHAAIREKALSKQRSSAAAAQSSVKRPRSAGGVNTRPRDRITGLPPFVGRMDPETAAGVAASRIEGDLDEEAIFTRLLELVPDEKDRYGYLTWRSAAADLSPGSETRTLSSHEDLVKLAVVLDQEKQRLDGLVRAHGPILEKSRLAKRALDSEFRDLLDEEDIGRSAADELRRTRDAFDFLRRALVLTIACQEHDTRLWEMLERLEPPPLERLVETSPQLERAIRRLTSFINAVERLLATDTANLAEFYRISRAQLDALQKRRYDFLRPFRDADTRSGPSSRYASVDLAFQILPQGEQLRAFLGEIRTSKTYGGYRVDEHRLTVLEDLENHFGAERCTWHRGLDSSDGIDNRYLVLAIKSKNRVRDDAVAISPLAGRHATYIVRHDCADADWRTLFAQPKLEARLQGARKLLFTTNDGAIDQYRTMYNKIIKLLECDPGEFGQGASSGRNAAPPTSRKRLRLLSFWR